MPIPHEGPQTAAFLRALFSEDDSQRPEFDVGPAALRRSELIKMAEMIGETLDSNLGAKQMVPFINQWLLAGRYDHLANGIHDPASAAANSTRETADLKRELNKAGQEIAAMRQMFSEFVNSADQDEALAKMRAYVNGDDPAAQAEMEEDDILSGRAGGNLNAMSWEDVEAMSFADLRAYARDNCKLPTHKKNYETLLADVRKFLMIDPVALMADEDDDGADVNEAESEDVAHAATGS
ncbi:MAG: hypothetical protein VW338_00235 [Rhodospirillaceae bacterium]